MRNGGGGGGELEEAAPASRSIMQRVTHATLLHREPCYASTGQGGPEDLWRRRIFAGNREIRGIVAVFIPTASPSPPSHAPCFITPAGGGAAAKAIGFDAPRKY